MPKKLLSFLLLSLLASCQYFDKQVPSKDELLEKELKAIDWNQVDELPSVAACDSVADKAQRRQCFFEYLMLNIQQRLDSDTLAVLYPQLDTIEVKVSVLPDSKVTFEPRINDTTAYNTKAIDSILQHRLAGFPLIKPALKRGIPVKTQFTLPVILNVEKR